MAEKFLSTKDLKRVLGRKELMGLAIGSIIGSGIMVQMGTGIELTGRSANIAFLLSTFFTVCNLIPMIFVSSCMRFRGADYSQIGLCGGAADQFHGGASCCMRPAAAAAALWISERMRMSFPFSRVGHTRLVSSTTKSPVSGSTAMLVPVKPVCP